MYFLVIIVSVGVGTSAPGFGFSSIQMTPRIANTYKTEAECKKAEKAEKARADVHGAACVQFTGKAP